VKTFGTPTRPHGEIVTDQGRLVSQWVDENVDYILALTSLTDEEIIAFESKKWYREQLEHDATERDYHPPERHLRRLATRILDGLVTSLAPREIYPDAKPEVRLRLFCDSLDRVVVLTEFPELRSFIVTQALKTTAEPDAEPVEWNEPAAPKARPRERSKSQERRSRMLREWLKIADKDCELRPLIARCLEARFRAPEQITTTADPRRLYPYKPRWLNVGAIRWETSASQIYLYWKNESPLASPFERESLTDSQRCGLEWTLEQFRGEYSSGQKLCYHQILAHFNICYSLGTPARPWELIALANNLSVPTSTFFLENVREIQEAITESPCRTFVERMGAAQRNKLAAIADKEGCFFGSTDRQFPRSIAMTDRDGVIAIADPYLPFRHLAMVMPGVNLPWRYIRELEDVDPRMILHATLREFENIVRQAKGFPSVGGWLNEALLLSKVRKLLSRYEVLSQPHPSWLGRQHLDIFVPDLKLAFEYHGAQHYQPVEYFGGERGFEEGQKRDARKRDLCKANGVTLVEIKHDEPWSEEQLEMFLTDYVGEHTSNV
jgi:hypothetical protein